MDKEKLVRKVKKLYALGESPNQAEAEAAIQKAHELVTIYNIDQNDLKKKNKMIKKEIYVGKTIPFWLKCLANYIANHFYCYSFRYARYEEKIQSNYRRRNWYLVFVGTISNIEIAIYTYNFLVSTGKRLSIINMEKFTGNKRREKNSYLIGFSEGIRSVLNAQKEHEQKKGLIYVNLAELYVKNNIKLRKSKIPSTIDPKSDSLLAGYKDGKGIKINPGIEQEKVTTTSKCLGVC